MKKEIIIPRKKSKSIKYTIGMFLSTILLILPIVIYFADISWITSDIPLFVVIMCSLFAPVLTFCTVRCFKQIFNEKPVLIVSEIGINEGMNDNSVGMIRWEDIQNINIIPYMDNTYFICIFLKRPEKYILNQKLLNKLNRQSTRNNKWRHISFSSLYFKKEFNEVLEVIRYYFAQYNVIG